jgi:serine phosphatase RsbU (regulator of sigma subunit)
MSNLVPTLDEPAVGQVHKLRRVHPATLIVVAACLVLTLAGSLATWTLHRNTEQRLLDQRTSETGAVLTAAISGVQTPLAAAAALVEASNGDAAIFEATMGRLVSGGQFAAAALVEVTSNEVLATVGSPILLVEAQPARVAAMVAQAVATDQLSVIDTIDLPGRRLGYAFTAGPPIRYVVYAESALPAERTGAPRPSAPFETLDYAIYLGASDDPDGLLYTSRDEPGITGRRSSTTVAFGDRQLTLVAATSANLAGTLSRLLPFLIGVGGLAFAAAAGWSTQRLERGRRRAEALTENVSQLLAEQQHRTDTLQRSLLPRELVAPAGLAIAGRYWPAGADNEIGGDFYDLFQVDAERWAVVIGDVCGKGVEAAALTGVTRHTIRAAARHLRSPAEVLWWTHEAIRGFGAATYCTVCFAYLTVNDGRVTFEVAVGGHPLPVRCRANGVVETIGVPGTVLGLLEPKLTSATTELDDGDTVVLYTDGITDAPPGEAVPIEELFDVVRAHRDNDPEELADAIRVSIEAHRPIGRGDDTALLVLRVGVGVGDPPRQPVGASAHAQQTSGD